MPEKKSVRVDIPLTPNMKEQWSYWAERKNMTIPQFVRHCVSVCIMAYEKNQKK